jgi:MFS family permease
MPITYNLERNIERVHKINGLWGESLRLMSDRSFPDVSGITQGKFYYGWVIVAACALMIAVTYGLLYSYSVFFKPLSDYFNWDRSTVSLVYSISLIIRGAVSIAIGWLADRYGPIKISVFCGFMIGLGLILSSQIHTLWQLFITYGVIEAIGLSGAFGIGTAMTSRWFTKNRGLALGIVSTGSGLGTLFIVPGTERIINSLSWSPAFIICGAVAGILMIGSALLLRSPPQSVPLLDEKPTTPIKSPDGLTLIQALKEPQMILFMGSLLLFFFGIQLIMVHLVSYATDTGISPLVAATFVSVIGAVSITGRLSIGVWVDKTGLLYTLIITRFLLAVSFILLIFTKSLWMFYLFAVVFGFPYGGEVPQIPLFIGKHWGTKTMATLVGLNMFVTCIGGALGAWLAGEIFDTTQSYSWAFIAGTAASLGSLILVLKLKRQSLIAD